MPSPLMMERLTVQIIHTCYNIDPDEFKIPVDFLFYEEWKVQVNEG